MLWPSWMAWIAASCTGAGTGVSQTPWARLMPPMRSHSVVMARISDWMAAAGRWLKQRREAEAAGVVGMGKILVLSSYMLGGGDGQVGAGRRRRRRIGTL